MATLAVTTNRRAKVEWRDLVRLSRIEQLWELSLSAPWLAASLVCYGRGGGWVVAGAGCTFFFFLTGLRQSHNAQHYSIGIGRRGQDLMLLALSVLMMMSMHAVQVTHLAHHRNCLGEGDIEAGDAQRPWYVALLLGPIFPFRLIAEALRRGNAGKRRWIAAELGLMAIWAGIVLFVLHVPALKWHLLAVSAGECLTACFAVWTVHHGCDAHDLARTQRGWLKNFVSYGMFYHLEHHLFPAVPTGHLLKLAERLDAAEPELQPRQVW
jgi:fatty acid desaturase